tara:strand:+ start:1235 stop:1507 length:273 start_codon:yes stop_codon:yes gene_type:complete
MDLNCKQVENIKHWAVLLAPKELDSFQPLFGLALSAGKAGSEQELVPVCVSDQVGEAGKFRNRHWRFQKAPRWRLGEAPTSLRVQVPAPT